MKKDLKKITVLYNLADKNENLGVIESDEDTQKSALDVAENLKTVGYEVEELGINVDELEKIREIKSDLVFNLVEWSGRHCAEGVSAAKILEETKIPFTGSDSMGYELSCDKTKMKPAMGAALIPTPEWMIFDGDIKGVVKSFKYPVIVKPAREHCGIGITQASIANNESEMRTLVAREMSQYQQPVLVEEFITGREMQVTVLERSGQPWVLPPAEIAFVKKEGHWPVLTYEGKWQEGSEEWNMSNIAAARLEPMLWHEVERISKEAYKRLGGRDYPRLDIRLRGNDIFVLEINNNPGIDFSIDSGIGISAREAGFTFGTLLKHIVENAYWRFGQR